MTDRSENLRFARDSRGTQAVELAFIMPVLILLTCGVIDFGRFLFAVNGAHKAAQLGAQTAVTRDSVLLHIRNWFQCEARAGRISRTDNGLTCFDANRTSRVRLACDFGIATCTSAGCDWRTDAASSDIAFDRSVFDAVVRASQSAYPYISASNVVVEYRPTPLGFVGKPTPVTEVRVTVQDVPFQFLLLPVFLVMEDPAITLAPQTVTLTAEDLSDNTCAEQGFVLDNTGTRCQTTRTSVPSPGVPCP